LVEGGWGLVAESLVGPLGIELFAEGVEEALLGSGIGGRWAGRLGLEGLMHPLVAAVLLGVGGLDQFGADTQTDPPDREPGEAADGGGGGERVAVIGADSLGQAVDAEDPLEILLRRDGRRRELRSAAEQVSAEAVGHGQGVAVKAVASLELALEVGRPELVGIGALGGGPAGVREVASAAAILDQPQAFEDVTGGAGRGKPQVGLPPGQPQNQLAGTPVRVLLSSLGQGFHDLRISSMRAMPRRPTSVLQPRHSILPKPPKPLVPGHPADPVALTQLRHREQLSLRIQHEPHPLPHLRRFAPGHPPPPGPASCAKLSTMLPVKSVNHLPGLYQSEA
jgi:hypothetical protein